MRRHLSRYPTHHRPIPRLLLIGIAAAFAAACTTPSLHSRQVLRRGQTGAHPNAPWWPADGVRLEVPFRAAQDLPRQLADLLEKRLSPAATEGHSPPRRSRRIGTPRLACHPHKKRFRCYAQVFVEVLGRNAKVALWAREGVATLEMDTPPGKGRRARVAKALLAAAIDAALAAPALPKTRPRGALGQAIDRGDTSNLPAWHEELRRPAGENSRRAALWLAFGHLADSSWLARLTPLATYSPEETEAKARAMAWIDAAGMPGRPGVDPTSNVPSRPRGVHSP
jgi:hypothetical protein